MKVEACIACGCSEYSGEETRSTAVAVSVGAREFVQPEYGIRCCAECGLFYKTAILSDEELTEYYDQVDFRKWEVAGYFPTERAALRFLRSLPQGSRLMDFGCSTGRLLSPLTANYECHGFDLNEAATREAAQKGVRVLSTEELNAATDRFDAVIASDVFEHLTKPTNILRNLCRSLKTKGRLAIITGNGDARYCRRNPALFWYFRTPEHVCMLTRRYANFLEEALGLRLQIWEELCHYDVSFGQRVHAHARDFAYWGARPESPVWIRSLLNVAPVFRRAKYWSGPPGLTCTRDHVLAVFEKQ